MTHSLFRSQAARVKSERDEWHPNQVACSVACCSTQLHSLEQQIITNDEPCSRSLPVHAYTLRVAGRRVESPWRGWRVVKDEVDITRRERNMELCMAWRRPTAFRCRAPGQSELSLFPLFQKPGLRFRAKIVQLGVVSCLICGVWRMVIGGVCVDRASKGQVVSLLCIL